MSAILALAIKDLRVLIRQPAALFFVLGWPLITAVLFGLVFGGGGDGTSKPRIAVVDNDATAGSRAFVAQLQGIAELTVDPQTEPAARELVRKGQRTGAVVVPKGYGAASQRLFYGTPPHVQVMIDPSRKAESAMLQGMLQRAAGERLSKQMMDAGASRDSIAQARDAIAGLPAEKRETYGRFFDELDRFVVARPASVAGATGSEGAWQPLTVAVSEITAQRRGPRNAFGVTFPQGLLWGIIGCIMSFASSLVQERVQGTLTRLRASPLTPTAILLGKGLACFAAIVAVAILLIALAVTVFGVRPSSPGLLVLAVFAAGVGFTGIMMLVASLGNTVSTVSGSGWAIMMPLMLFGGGMIPLFIMPSWMATIGHASPVKWATLAMEGAIWRGFTTAEMLLPVGILLVVGIVTFALGSLRFTRRVA